ncbi:cold-shock protein [Paenibacillus cellulositrophicus]|uniref:cold-shock protein n=1 Tax=Paenibacillus TaxID=44249 RepID=UPI0011A07938|nr:MULTISPECIES: cold-shock protein [Paenibacillus]GIO63077.1 hypothetical protein J43TS9_46510 [Paenibacillus cineris]
MYFGKKVVEEIPEADTLIWSCVNDGCNGWMRDNFAFETEPVCVQCNSPMVSSMKVLPLVVNDHPTKMLKKGTLI